jgi:MFS superfamily sulfate permease-like transporter
LFGIATGFLNMTVDEFWDYTPKQLQLKLDNRKEFEDMLQRMEWERIRFQTTALINKDRKRKDQTDLIKFDWEKKSTIKNIDKERKKAMYLINKANKENKT